MTLVFNGIIGRTADSGDVGATSVDVVTDTEVLPSGSGAGEGQVVIVVAVFGTLDGLMTLGVVDDAPQPAVGEYRLTRFGNEYSGAALDSAVQPNTQSLTFPVNGGIRMASVTGAIYWGLPIGSTVTVTFSEDTVYRDVLLLSYSGRAPSPLTTGLGGAAGGVVGGSVIDQITPNESPLSTYYISNDPGSPVDPYYFVNEDAVEVLAGVVCAGSGLILDEFDDPQIDPFHYVTATDDVEDQLAQWTRIAEGGYPAVSGQVGDNVWGLFQASWAPNTTWQMSTFFVPNAWAAAYTVDPDFPPAAAPNGGIHVVGFQPGDFDPDEQPLAGAVFRNTWRAGVAVSPGPGAPSSALAVFSNVWRAGVAGSPSAGAPSAALAVFDSELIHPVG